MEAAQRPRVKGHHRAVMGTEGSGQEVTRKTQNFPRDLTETWPACNLSFPWRLDGALTAGGFTVRPGNGLELDFRAGCGEVVQSLVLTQSKPPLRHHCPWQILAGRGRWDT